MALQYELFPEIIQPATIVDGLPERLGAELLANLQMHALRVKGREEPMSPATVGMVIDMTDPSDGLTPHRQAVKVSRSIYAANRQSVKPGCILSLVSSDMQLDDDLRSSLQGSDIITAPSTTNQARNYRYAAEQCIERGLEVMFAIKSAGILVTREAVRAVQHGFSGDSQVSLMYGPIVPDHVYASRPEMAMYHAALEAGGGLRVADGTADRFSLRAGASIAMRAAEAYMRIDTRYANGGMFGAIAANIQVQVIREPVMTVRAGSGRSAEETLAYSLHLMQLRYPPGGP